MIWSKNVFLKLSEKLWVEEEKWELTWIINHLTESTAQHFGATIDLVSEIFVQRFDDFRFLAHALITFWGLHTMIAFDWYGYEKKNHYIFLTLFRSKRGSARKNDWFHQIKLDWIPSIYFFIFLVLFINRKSAVKRSFPVWLKQVFLNNSIQMFIRGLHWWFVHFCGFG